MGRPVRRPARDLRNRTNRKRRRSDPTRSEPCGEMRLILLAAVLAMALVPAHAQHCTDVAILSAVDQGNGIRRGVDPGLAGCTAARNDESLSTNLVVPAAPYLIVSVAKSVPFDREPLTGTITVGGVETELSFASNAIEMRWDSQSVPNTGGDATTTVTAVGGTTVSVTYRAVA